MRLNLKSDALVEQQKPDFILLGEFMKKMIALLCLMSALGSFNVFAGGNEPVLKLKNGKRFTPDNVKNDGEYDVYSPFELIKACYEGSARRVVKEILFNDDFLDHAGDYSCSVEAKLSSDERVIQYTCADESAPSRSFKIVPCAKN